MNLGPKRGERRADGKYFLGFGGLEWVARQQFRDAANIQLRASGNCSYAWKAALSLQARTKAAEKRVLKLEKKRGMNADDWKRIKGREYGKKRYYSISAAARREKRKLTPEKVLATQAALQINLEYDAKARAYIAAKKLSREVQP